MILNEDGFHKFLYLNTFPIVEAIWEVLVLGKMCHQGLRFQKAKGDLISLFDSPLQSMEQSFQLLPHRYACLFSEIITIY